MVAATLPDAPVRPPILPQQVAGIQRELPEATHMPGALYTSDAVFALEKQKIFLKEWLCVARAEELPNPGDFLTRRIVGEPVVLARQADGSMAAWLNMCLHRGVEVAFGSGNAHHFRCPYHAWSYDLAGKLLGTPLGGFGADLTVDRMTPVRVAAWRGWIFINFDPHGPEFESWIAPFDGKLDFYRSEQCRMAARIEFEVPCNWKFIAENLIDWYHAMALHAATIGKYYQLGSGKDFPAELLPNGCSVIEFDASLRSANPNFPFPPLPWLPPDAVFSAKAVMFPNVNISANADSLRMWHLWPQTTGTTQAVYYILLPESSFDTPGFDEKIAHFTSYIQSVVAEDRIALESLQRAASSPHFNPGRLARLEVEIHHLLRQYVKVMGF